VGQCGEGADTNVRQLRFWLALKICAIFGEPLRAANRNSSRLFSLLKIPDPLNSFVVDRWSWLFVRRYWVARADSTVTGRSLEESHTLR
jgi:hypothetical protein